MTAFDVDQYKKTLFNIKSDSHFEVLALEVFKHQYQNNTVYKRFCDYLGKTPENTGFQNIPFLPVEFFKNHQIVSAPEPFDKIFTSSGTTGQITSSHYVKDHSLYVKSFTNAFEIFYGNPADYCVLALLPAYLERKGSSLVDMADHLIQQSQYEESGFYLHNIDDLVVQLLELEQKNIPVLLLGVTFALLDVAEKYQLQLKNTIVMETGGMKGRRKEITRETLHNRLTKKLGVQYIHSEYGMTELLSQAYSKGKGIYQCPPWMRVIIRDQYDPFSRLEEGKTGGMNVVDLANIHSCSFIETKDLGRLKKEGFEVLGRFDNSDIRGCNLMVD